MLLGLNTYSQNQQIKDKKFDFIPKSPDVASLGKYIDKPISLSSGSANVNIPLYSLNINSNLSIPVSLVYNSQGVKISEMVSSVGLGWDLSCLSFVTRNIRGKEDNYIDPVFYNQNNTLAKQNLASNATNTYPNAWLDQNSNAVYTEPDEFSVSLFNQSFKFYYDFKTQKFIQTPQSDVKIIPNISPTNGNIIDMKVIDASGNTYYFGRSYDEDNNIAVVDELGSITINTESAFTSGIQPRINTWHLVKIETSDKKVVKFFYDENYVPATDMNKQNIHLTGQYKYLFNTLDFASGIYNNVQLVDGVPTVVGNLYPISYSIYSQNKEGRIYNIYSLPSTQDKILKKIVYDKTQIDFEKSINIRNDQNNYSYEKVIVKYNNRTIKSFSLNHTYFNDGGGLSGDASRNNNYIFTQYFDKSQSRLKLNSISEYGTNNSFVGNYSFDYYEGYLPSKLSFAQDFFGYYNGKTTNTELIPNVYFKLEDIYKKAGTAERNVDINYSKIGALKNIIYPTKGKTEFEYENHTFAVISDITETPMNLDLFSIQTHNIEFAAEQSVDPNTGNILPLNTVYEKEIEFNKDVTSDISADIQKVLQNPENSNSWMNSFYIRVYKVNSNGNRTYLFPISSTTSNFQHFFTHGKYLFEATRMTHTVDEGGLQEEQGSFAMTISYQDQASFQIDNSPTSHIAGGLRIKSITQKDYNDNTLLKTEYKYEDVINGQKYSSGILYGYPLLVSNNYYFGVNKFYGLIDFPLKGGSSHNVLYGKVVEESVDNNEKRIRKIYHFDNNFIPPTNDTNSDVRLKTPNFGWRIGNLKEIEYYKSDNTNNFYLIKKDSIIYNQKGIFTSDELGVSIEPRDVIAYSSLFDVTKYKYEYYPLYTDFNYEATKITKEYINNSIVSTTTTNNFNNINSFELTATKTQSPDGSISETSYKYAQEKNNQLMISKNMIGIPLETTTTQTIGGVTKTLGKTETVYPTSLPTAQSGNLVLPLSSVSYDVLNNTPSTDVTYDKYDDKGNPLQYTTKDGIPVTIIWGYSKTQPIAKIEGIGYDQLTAAVSISGIVTASDNDASDPTKEGLLLDALNSFRKEAALEGKKISTYTYDPLIGVTSITPPSGVRQSYQYDSANRLKEGDIRGKNSSGTYINKKVSENNYNYKP